MVAGDTTARVAAGRDLPPSLGRPQDGRQEREGTVGGRRGGLTVATAIADPPGRSDLERFDVGPRDAVDPSAPQRLGDVISPELPVQRHGPRLALPASTPRLHQQPLEGVDQQHPIAGPLPEPLRVDPAGSVRQDLASPFAGLVDRDLPEPAEPHPTMAAVASVADREGRRAGLGHHHVQAHHRLVVQLRPLARGDRRLDRTVVQTHSHTNSVAPWAHGGHTDPQESPNACMSLLSSIRPNSDARVGISTDRKPEQPPPTHPT